MSIRIQTEDFDLSTEVERLTAGDDGAGRREIGAVVSFVGLVRDMVGAGQPGLTALVLEHYPGMAERELAEIEAEAHRRWPLQATLVVHRVGRLLPGDRIVLTAAASVHRDAAFEACRFLMDWLKTRAPFWKREDSPSGSHWVEARDEDGAAAARWK